MGILRDLRHGFRLLMNSPAFTAAAVIVLALGIGANTAIFSVVSAVLLRPLPFEDPSRLVQIWHTPPQKSFPGVKEFAVSSANYLDWKAQNHAFEQMSIYNSGSPNLTGTGEPESLRGRHVEPTYFSVLRVRPMLGRTFSEEENGAGHDNVVVLSYDFWKTRFAANPAIVGQQVTLDGLAHTIVGVMPPKFGYPNPPQVWLPMSWTDKDRAVRGEHHYGVIARLKPGVDLKQAQAEMDTISNRLAQQYPADDAGWGAIVVPMREELVGEVRPALLILLGAVAFVLLIACANVANLVLAKTLSRRKEIAIRTALGASRGRLLAQILSETVLLAVFGGALGLVVAHFGVGLIVKFLASKLPRAADINLDATVLAFTFLISIVTGLLAGLLPAIRLTGSHFELNDALKQGLGRGGADSGGRRTRNVLVVSEVALSLVLLIGAGLLIRSLWRLRNVNPGFDAHNVLTLDTAVPSKKFTEPAQQIAFFQQILERVRSLPGVESAAATDSIPLTGGSMQPILIEGHPVVAMADQPEVAVRIASTGYMRTMHIPLLRGRDISDSDTASQPGVIVVSESLAKRFWPNEDAIGKRLTLTFSPKPIRQVVGIVSDVKIDGLDVPDPVATLYVPMTQISVPDPAYGTFRAFGLTLVVRAASNPSSIASAVTNAVHQVDSTVPVLNVITMEDLIADSLSQHRFNMLLLAVFAALAVLLAAVGIYSVLSYAVRRRVREIGIRMALGARIQDVLRMILLEGMKPTLLGVVIGLAGAFLLSRVLASLIYGVSATDLPTFATVSLLLVGIGFLASIVPAYRATRVEPVKTLRDE